VGFGLVLRGETVRGGGWMARARRVLAGGPPDLAEHGFLQWWDAFQAIRARLDPGGTFGNDYTERVLGSVAGG